MRILFASPMAGNWGGSEWLWSETALHLQKSGHSVAFHTPWPKNHPRIQELRSAGAREFSDHIPTRWPVRLWRRCFARCTSREQAFADFRPDIVLINQSRQDEGLEWLPLLRGTATPYAVLNQIVIDTLYLEPEQANAMAELYSGARAVWFVAERSRRQVELQLGVPLSGARVARNPYRANRDAPLPWPGGEGLRLAMVARLDPEQKGHDVMFEVLAREVWRQRPITLHIYGEGSGGERLRRVKAMLGLEQVHFAGFAANIGDVWSNNHVVAVPSRHEGTPIAMVEGMLLGRPVFGTAVAGIPEFVEDGVSGILFRAADPELLDAALERLWAVRTRLPEMGRAARARALALAPADPAATFARSLVSAFTS